MLWTEEINLVKHFLKFNDKKYIILWTEPETVRKNILVGQLSF